MYERYRKNFTASELGEGRGGDLQEDAKLDALGAY